MTDAEAIPFLACTFGSAEVWLMPTDRVHEGPPALLPLPLPGADDPAEEEASQGE